MKCANGCGRDLIGRQVRFCSDRCRKQSLRAATARLKSDTNPDKLGQNPEVGQKSDKARSDWHTPKGVAICSSLLTQLDKPEILDNIDLTKAIVHTMFRSELYLAINRYPQDTWKDSVEYATLLYRLETRMLAELKEDGYWIPSWKYKEVA